MSDERKEFMGMLKKEIDLMEKGLRVSELPWQKISRPTVYPDLPPVEYRAVPEPQAQAGYEGAERLIALDGQEIRGEVCMELGKIIKLFKEFIGEEDDSKGDG